jgi:hypothetical protein
MGQLTLYDISNEYAEAAEKLADMDLPAEAVNDTLEGLRGDLDTKAKNVAMFCQNLETLANQIKEAETKMAHRRKVLENRAASIKAYIKTCMESAGITKIECPYFKMAIRQNPPRVVIDNMEAIPESLMRTPEPPPPEPDKKAIGELLKNGSSVTWAHLESGTRLEIK